jgi:hypothetical protein
MQPSLAVASVDATQRETLFKFMGQYLFETVMLAVEPDSVLLTDDLIQVALAVAIHSVDKQGSFVRRGIVTGVDGQHMGLSTGSAGLTPQQALRRSVVRLLYDCF